MQGVALEAQRQVRVGGLGERCGPCADKDLQARIQQRGVKTVLRRFFGECFGEHDLGEGLGLRSPKPPDAAEARAEVEATRLEPVLEALGLDLLRAVSAGFRQG